MGSAMSGIQQILTFIKENIDNFILYQRRLNSELVFYCDNKRIVIQPHESLPICITVSKRLFGLFFYPSMTIDSDDADRSGCRDIYNDIRAMSIKKETDIYLAEASREYNNKLKFLEELSKGVK